MVNRLRQARKQRGFTLIELLIVVAIIGIIAAILIPNLIDALQKAKQKRTVADMRNTGNAWMSWLTDQVSGAAAGAAAKWEKSNYGKTLNYADIVNMLRPNDSFFYMQEIPQRDGWKYPYEYLWSGSVATVKVMAICSGARNGNACSGSYTPGAFIATDYDQDIVWSDGYFVTWPGGSGS